MIRIQALRTKLGKANLNPSMTYTNWRFQNITVLVQIESLNKNVKNESRGAKDMHSFTFITADTIDMNGVR